MARLINALEQILDDNGDPLASGLLDFYESGGSTVRKTTYADSAETIANPNPLIINGNGVVPNVFGTGTYRVVVRTAEGAQLRQRDPVGGDTSLNFGSDWISSISYGLADVVKEDGQYWESQTAANSGNQPSLDGGTNWLLFLGDVATNTTNIAANTAGKADLTGAAFTGAISTITINTALSDAAATLTAAQLIGGEFTITPTAARIQTTDTATAIIAAMTDSVDNSSFDITMINLAAFDVTIAAGTGVTLVGNMAVNNGSATFRVRRLTSSTVSVTRLEDSKEKVEELIINDEKPSGTPAGTFTSGDWRDRVLNAIVVNTIPGASLSANTITLPAGDYYISASAPALNVDEHQAKIRDVTVNQNLIIGSSERTTVSGGTITRSFVTGRVSLDSEKDLKLQHRCSATRATDGFGEFCSFSVVEVYANIYIKKVG